MAKKEIAIHKTSTKFGVWSAVVDIWQIADFWLQTTEVKIHSVVIFEHLLTDN